jgi:predicted nucleic acid-binding protein
VILGWLKEEPDKIAECTAGIRHAERGELTIITSALTLAEVLRLKGKDPIPESDRDLVRRFFENEYIALYDVDRTVAEMAQDVVWTYGVKPKDAIHVATALSVGSTIAIEQLDTFDGDLISLSGHVGIPPLKIGRPDLPGDLFTDADARQTNT